MLTIEGKKEASTAFLSLEQVNIIYNFPHGICSSDKKNCRTHIPAMNIFTEEYYDD